MKINHLQRAEISRCYAAGEAGEAIGERFGCSGVTVRRIVRERGGSVRPRSGKYSRKHAVNESFFDEIDTEAKAYWLGFLAADGHISRGPTAIQLCLGESDGHHVERFKRDIESSAPAYIKVMPQRVIRGRTIRETRGMRIDVCSERLVAGLHRHGFRKYSLEHHAACVEPHLTHHYFRGLFDGDGCLSFANVRSKATKTHLAGTTAQCILSMCGGERLVAAFADYCRDIVGQVGPLTLRGKCYYFHIHGNRKCARVARAMYADATIYLARKHALYLALLNREWRSFYSVGDLSSRAGIMASLLG